MKITIKQLELTNFRNIGHAIYDFGSNQNAVCGKNAIGKSNILQGIMWLFTGNSLVGGSNDTINKPIGNSGVIVSVKATISSGESEHTIEKQYAEIITGGVLSGHTTTMIIDNIVFPTLKEAELKLTEMLGTNNRIIAMNPLFVDFTDYKELRKMVIALIGDVKPQSILDKNMNIANTLINFKNYDYNCETYAKFLSGEIKKAKEIIKTKNAYIAFLDNDIDMKAMRFSIAECDKRLIEKTITIKKEIADTQNKITNYETEQIALEKYIELRLNELNNRVKNIFGNISWQLIESNIKEGSYKEVCYPLIVGKNTKFENGSTSEKIITGIKIIEAIKWATNGNDLPIVFDEGEALDSESLLTKIKTKAQVITAKVNDEYETPTIKSWEKGEKQ